MRSRLVFGLILAVFGILGFVFGASWPIPLAILVIGLFLLASVVLEWVAEGYERDAPKA